MGTVLGVNLQRYLGSHVIRYRAFEAQRGKQVYNIMSCK